MSDEATRRAQDVPLPGGNFRLFVQKLGYQALIGLGILENPLTRKREANLAHAQTVIDDLMMLRDKMRGNLEAEEEEQLTTVIDELQRQYVTLVQKSASS